MYLYIYADRVVVAGRDDRLLNDPDVVAVLDGQALQDIWECQDFPPGKFAGISEEEMLEVLAEVYGGEDEVADLFLRLDRLY